MGSVSRRNVGTCPPCLDRSSPRCVSGGRFWNWLCFGHFAMGLAKIGLLAMPPESSFSIRSKSLSLYEMEFLTLWIRQGDTSGHGEEKVRCTLAYTDGKDAIGDVERSEDPRNWIVSCRSDRVALPKEIEHISLVFCQGWAQLKSSVASICHESHSTSSVASEAQSVAPNNVPKLGSNS